MLAFINAHLKNSSSYEFLIEILKHLEEIVVEDPEVTRRTLDTVAERVQSFDDRLRACYHSPFFPAKRPSSPQKLFRREDAPTDDILAVIDQLQVAVTTPPDMAGSAFTTPAKAAPGTPTPFLSPEYTKTIQKLKRLVSDTPAPLRYEVSPFGDESGGSPDGGPDRTPVTPFKVSSAFSTKDDADTDTVGSLVDKIKNGVVAGVYVYPDKFDEEDLPRNKSQLMELTRELNGVFTPEERQWIQLYQICDHATGIRTPRPYYEIRAQTILPCIDAIKDWLLEPTGESGDLHHAVLNYLEPFEPLPVPFGS